jgi:hypothetical protein
MTERSHMRFMVPGRCSRTVPRMLAMHISFGRFSMYSRFDGSAAAAARGLRWPAQASTYQLGGPPHCSGLYNQATKRHAEGSPSAGVEGGRGRYLHKTFGRIQPPARVQTGPPGLRPFPFGRTAFDLVLPFSLLGPWCCVLHRGDACRSIRRLTVYK